MDFLIVFIIGYCSKDIVSYIKHLVNYEQYTYEWDTELGKWTGDDLP